MFEALLNNFKESGLNRLKLGTGYLNLMSQVRKALEAKFTVDVLTSSPKANSFYKAGGIKSMIPSFYRLNGIKMLNQNKSKNINLYEWARGDWTYHAKGAWFYEDEQLPSLSIIGSSNYSHRSNRRDTEVQLYIAPSEQAVELKHRLHNEANDLFRDGT